jgi:hypothetical protein
MARMIGSVGNTTMIWPQGRRSHGLSSPRALISPEKRPQGPAIHMSEKSATLPCAQPLGTRSGKRAERAFPVKNVRLNRAR